MTSNGAVAATNRLSLFKYDNGLNHQIAVSNVVFVTYTFECAYLYNAYRE